MRTLIEGCPDIGPGEYMNCLICDESAPYNRAVLATGDDEPVGGLCSKCERRIFDTQLHRIVTSNEETCLRCSDPGWFLLPEHHIELEYVAGIEVESEGYPIEDSTPRLCHQHAEALLGLDEETEDLGLLVGGEM